MIKVCVSTRLGCYLDCFGKSLGYEKEEWPTEFCCAPRVGERVLSVRGVSMWVVGVIHKGESLSVIVHDHEDT